MCPDSSCSQSHLARSAVAAGPTGISRLVVSNVPGLLAIMASFLQTARGSRANRSNAGLVPAAAQERSLLFFQACGNGASLRQLRGLGKRFFFRPARSARAQRNAGRERNTQNWRAAAKREGPATRTAFRSDIPWQYVGWVDRALRCWVLAARWGDAVDV